MGNPLAINHNRVGLQLAVLDKIFTLTTHYSWKFDVKTSLGSVEVWRVKRCGFVSHVQISRQMRGTINPIETYQPSTVHGTWEREIYRL